MFYFGRWPLPLGVFIFLSLNSRRLDSFGGNVVSFMCRNLESQLDFLLPGLPLNARYFIFCRVFLSSHLLLLHVCVETGSSFGTVNGGRVAVWHGKRWL